MIPSDLDLLIQSCETERKSLEKAIKDSLEERDYVIAHYYSEGLAEVNNRLSVLQSFKDPLYEEKRHIAEMEKGLNKINFSQYSSFRNKKSKEKFIYHVKEIRKKHVEEKQKEIDALSKDKNGFFYDTQEIDEALFNLYDGTYKSFKLVIAEIDNEIIFIKEGSTLLVKIKLQYSPNDPDFVFDNRVSKYLGSLGFEFNVEDGFYRLEYDWASFKDALPIKIIIARLMFDKHLVYNISNPVALVCYK